MKRIVIFASGSGTNAENIVNYFRNHPKIKVVKILSNKKEAFVLERAKKLIVPSASFTKKDLYETDLILKYLLENADFIVLAGFLWKIPNEIIMAFLNRIVNIHPALLPKYGGKGMYGMQVHNAVVENKETESGITIHYVNEKYDEGAIIFQKSVQILPTDTAENVAEKIHILEQENFPEVIEKVILKNG